MNFSNLWEFFGQRREVRVHGNYGSPEAHIRKDSEKRWCDPYWWLGWKYEEEDPEAAKSNGFFLCGAIRVKPECDSSAVKYMHMITSDIKGRNRSGSDTLEDSGSPETCGINPRPARSDFASFCVRRRFCEGSNRGRCCIDWHAILTSELQLSQIRNEPGCMLQLKTLGPPGVYFDRYPPSKHGLTRHIVTKTFSRNDMVVS